jgi:hypothetical protein
MNAARWITAAALFAAFWCAGAYGLLPRMEKKLERTAQEALAAQNTLTGRLDRVQVLFEGQTARLQGKVRAAQDQLIIRSTIENLVRAPTLVLPAAGRRLNPVAAVQDVIEISPYPPGWMLLASDGPKARLIGTAATDVEGRDLVNAVADRWSSQGGQARGELRASLDDHDEAADVSATLASIPAPPENAPHHVGAWLARLGGRFEPLKLGADDAALRDQAERAGVQDSEWQKSVLPLIQELRAAQKAATARESEAMRLAALPPGHLFLAVRDQRVLLAGAVGSAAVKRALLDEALGVFATRRVHDAIRVDDARRPAADFPPLTTALLPASSAEAKSFHLAISGHAWQPLDWRGGRDDTSWKEPLPQDLDAALLRQDNAMLIEWLQGGADPMPVLTRTQPAFAVLVVSGKKVFLCGQIAEPALHAQLVSAARQVYAPGFVIHADAFAIRAHCETSADLIHTAKSLPPPTDAPFIALARPGEIWSVLPATPALLAPGALGKSSLIPAGLPPNLVEEASAEALEELRLHLAPRSDNQSPKF